MNAINQILVLAACYMLLYLLCFWAMKMKGDTLLSPKVQNGIWIILHLRHTGGIVIMVLLPLLLIKEVPKETLIVTENYNLIQVLTLMITGLVLFLAASKDAAKVKYNSPVVNKHSSIQAVLHIIFRSSFLVGYEWFFRGFILMSCVTLYGVLPAITINIVLYSFIHLINGKKEFLGSIPFGIILCVFTLWCHSVWPAVFLHLVLSFSFEFRFLQQFIYKPSKFVL